MLKLIFYPLSKIPVILPDQCHLKKKDYTVLVFLPTSILLSKPRIFVQLQAHRSNMKDNICTMTEKPAQ